MRSFFKTNNAKINLILGLFLIIAAFVKMIFFINPERKNWEYLGMGIFILYGLILTGESVAELRKKKAE